MDLEEVTFYSNEATAPRESCWQYVLVYVAYERYNLHHFTCSGFPYVSWFVETFCFVWTRVNGVWRWLTIQAQLAHLSPCLLLRTIRFAWDFDQILPSPAMITRLVYTCIDYSLFILPGHAKQCCNHCLISKAMARRFFGLRHLQT